MPSSSASPHSHSCPSYLLPLRPLTLPMARAGEPEIPEVSNRSGQVTRVGLHLGLVPLLCWASPPVEGRQVPAWRLPVLYPSVGVPPSAKRPKLAKSINADPDDSSTEQLSFSPHSLSPGSYLAGRSFCGLCSFSRGTKSHQNCSWTHLKVLGPSPSPCALSPQAVRKCGAYLSFVQL